MSIASVGCRQGRKPPEVVAPAAASTAAQKPLEVAAPSAAPTAAQHASPACTDAIPIFAGGKETGLVCPEAAQQQGLTIVDLSDDWVPYLLRGDEHGGDGEAQAHPYRATYVALANEQLGSGPEWDRARHDVFLELYGITPSFKVLASRLLDQERFECHRSVDSSPIAAITQPFIDVYKPLRSSAERAAVAALDARLVCERLLPANVKKRPRWRIQDALEAYQRKHTVVSRGLLDRETRGVLAEEPRELEWRAVLRALRARVVDATGVIEDGSARVERGQVFGRRLDSAAFYQAAYDALEEGAPDLISGTTEAAARALGWLDVDSVTAFFRERGADGTRRLQVALRLPPRPDYHGPNMELRAEIDRGDVWYDRPQLRGRVERRPTLTLWAKTAEGREIAVVRWPTTIGGWKKEAAGSWGRVVLRYKNSDVGPRVWRDLIALPAWLPPPKTPPRTIVRRGDGNKWLPDMDLVGPGYASAYGMVMLVHHESVQRKGQMDWDDHGIRTHGSVSYDSIQKGESHGCHRLFNQSAIQLASFLLQHHKSVRHGLDTRPFLHTFAWRGHTMKLPIPNRGYRFELTPPVPVEVLEGRIRGRLRRVPTKTLYVHK